MTARFDALAESWDAERGGYRSAPAVDALTRGGPFPVGRCLEVGSGTGLLTPLLLERWPTVLCLDLSAAMLRHARHGLRIRGDAARLPLADRSVVAVVIGDAPLFAAEVLRVLVADGVVVWSNALGPGAPFHVPTGTLVAALSAADGGRPWAAVTSEAGWGSWAVLRPGEPRAWTPRVVGAPQAELPPGGADERGQLLGWLGFLREAVVRKASGIEDEQARTRPYGRLLPLLGIVNHLTRVEWRWIDGGMLGEPCGRTEAEFFPGPELTVAAAIEAYRERARKTDAVAGSLPLDAPCRGRRAARCVGFCCT
jgi:SAM-dependent methyltransferase